MERGRPRVFDEAEALDAALSVFWRNGYQGASLSELTRAMGISKPSLYAAFGNKETLYLKALQRYRERELARHAEVLVAQTDLKSALRGFLRSVADMLTSPELPGGCMVVTSAVACDISALPHRVVAAIGETVDQAVIELLRERLRKALRQRRLPQETSVEQLADYFAILMSGMAVMAKLGISSERLFETIEQALCVIPDEAGDNP